MTRLNALKNELAAWGRYCRSVESHMAGRVRSPSATMEEIGRTGIFAMGTGFLDQRSESMQIPEWILTIDNQINALAPKMRAVIRAEFVKQGPVALRARQIGLSVPAFKRLLSMALVQLLSE